MQVERNQVGLDAGRPTDLDAGVGVDEGELEVAGLDAVGAARRRRLWRRHGAQPAQVETRGEHEVGAARQVVDRVGRLVGPGDRVGGVARAAHPLEPPPQPDEAGGHEHADDHHRDRDADHEQDHDEQHDQRGEHERDEPQPGPAPQPVEHGARSPVGMHLLGDVLDGRQARRTVLGGAAVTVAGVDAVDERRRGDVAVEPRCAIDAGVGPHHPAQLGRGQRHASRALWRA